MKQLIPILILILGCQSKENPYSTLTSEDYIFKNVNIVDVRTGEILENRNLVVRADTIANLNAEESESYGEAKVIDAKGKYVLPGLAEMHAHIPSPQWGRDNTNETLFLYLSNGVTTIRGMLGHPVHLELREQALNNEILSPRIFTSSPSVNGNTVPTVEDAIEKVTQYQADGYDFLKLHPGIKLQVFNEVVNTANEVGIPYAGHVSVFVGIENALNSGYASVDHVDGFIEGLVPKELGLDPESNGFFGFNFTDKVDESEIETLVRLTVDNEVWIVPTQSLFDRWFSPEPAENLASAPEMKYMPKSTIEQWVNSKKGLVENPDYSAEKWETFNGLRKEIINQLQTNGYGLLLGSDAPQVFNVPGFSLHHEMKGMIEAGLTPLEVIQTGTINPAKFFNMEGEFGEISIGASADFMLLNGDPVQSLENIKEPSGVMVRGRWLDRETIDKRLAEIAERAANI